MLGYGCFSSLFFLYTLSFLIEQAVLLKESLQQVSMVTVIYRTQRVCVQPTSSVNNNHFVSS